MNERPVKQENSVCEALGKREPLSRRDLLRAAAVGAAAATAGVGTLLSVGAAAATGGTGAGAGIRAFKLYTGPDNASHVLEGTIDLKDRADVVAIHFKETPAHSSYDWHPDPEPQYVITLSGTLEFHTRDGETFVLRPGDVLLAEDNTGSGHKWRLIDDQPWRRAYVVLKPGAKDSFVAKTAG
jgi:quercetin dioxygenase-like cupin family protein